ncbi:uncharacterized protein DSM5745_06022 [Aspergillus mulundensis]|uniref:BZIP domain-containing protein n=1 Tax=Aspergillus mulundensis TaxID=1810919 RepID=A0A3D8RZ83_9EURO|nr:hypothetical protein DSM5745_06022 [Aspergillus mulundensis]RDW79170.1 hypothetical protein DSM5745_06022 [Aspergillus mulundensis]
MDSGPLQLPADPTERRRLQNRIAQRRFRQKKQLKRSTDRGRADRPATSATSNGDTGLARSADRPFDEEASGIPCSGNARDEGIGFGLEAMDSSLNSCSSFNPPLDAQFLSFLASRSSSTTSPDTAPQGTSNSSGNTGPSTDPFSLHDVSGAIAAEPAAENGEGWLSSMHIAAQNGHERILGVLLEKGNMDPDCTDSDGRTPLYYAAIGGHDSVVRLLLNHGSRISHVDNHKRTVLHWAAHWTQLEVLRTLLEYWSKHERGTCDINAHDSHGWTPLHLAVQRGFDDGVLLLIQWGADINMKAKQCWMTERNIPFDMNLLVN